MCMTSGPISKTKEVEAFAEHNNLVDRNKFPIEDAENNKLRFLNCTVQIERMEQVYQKPAHINLYMIFNSHHLLEHKLSIIRTLHHQAQNISMNTEEKEKEHKRIKHFKPADTKTEPLSSKPRNMEKKKNYIIKQRGRGNREKKLCHSICGRSVQTKHTDPLQT